MFQLLQNLISQATAGYAVSVLHACFTQICDAITEAFTSLVGLRFSPLTFRWQEFSSQPTFIHLCITNPTSLQTSIHNGEAFKASRHHLGSAMKSNNEQFDLLTVTHQNGFRSIITIGMPTFISRLFFYLYAFVTQDENSLIKREKCCILLYIYLVKNYFSILFKQLKTFFSKIVS